MSRCGHPKRGIIRCMANGNRVDQRDLLRRARIGWDYLETERTTNLANMVTKDVLPGLESSFAYSQTLPARMTSGFAAFYQALGRESGRCSI